MVTWGALAPKKTVYTQLKLIIILNKVVYRFCLLLFYLLVYFNTKGQWRTQEFFPGGAGFNKFS